MGLPEFCRAVYKRKSPITNQAKFIQPYSNTLAVQSG